MSKNSRFNEDFSYIMLIVSLLTVFSVLFIKLTYLVALPYYKALPSDLKSLPTQGSSNNNSGEASVPTEIGTPDQAP